MRSNQISEPSRIELVQLLVDRFEKLSHIRKRENMITIILVVITQTQAPLEILHMHNYNGHQNIRQTLQLQQIKPPVSQKNWFGKKKKIWKWTHQGYTTSILIFQHREIRSLCSNTMNTIQSYKSKVSTNSKTAPQ